MTAIDIHSLVGGDIRTPHTVELLPRVVGHATGRNAEGKSVFLSTDDNDHHHRELVNKSAIATINYSTDRHPVELDGDVDIEYAHEIEVSKRLNPCSTEQEKTKSKRSSPKCRSRTNPLAAWWISLPEAHRPCSASTVSTAPS